MGILLFFANEFLLYKHLMKVKNSIQSDFYELDRKLFSRYSFNIISLLFIYINSIDEFYWWLFKLYISLPEKCKLISNFLFFLRFFFFFFSHLQLDNTNRSNKNPKFFCEPSDIEKSFAVARDKPGKRNKMVDTQHFCLRWNNYQSSITSAFENLRDDEDFVDVTLACDGRSLKAHRVVLSACSPYFRELLKVNWRFLILLLQFEFSHTKRYYFSCGRNLW